MRLGDESRESLHGAETNAICHRPYKSLRLPDFSSQHLLFGTPKL